MKLAVAGMPGCVVGFDRAGKALVYWDDLDLGRNTTHSIDSLIVDEAFTVQQLGLDFSEQAA